MQNSELPLFVRALSKLKLGARVSIGIYIIIALMAIPSVAMIIISSDYRDAYNGALENLDSINYIINEANAQSERILDYCIMHKNIEESGESDILVRMQYEFNKIKSRVEVDKYTQGQDTSQTEVVENLLDSYIDSYKTGVSKCDDSFSLAGDVDFYAMDNTADYLVENCTKMLDLELLRCADMKADISNRFFNVIKTTAIIFVVILVLALAFSLTLSMSITIPLKSLMSSISSVSEGDLSGEPVVIETEDELSELSKTYNTMTDNLKMLLASLKNISNDIDTSVNEVTATVQATTADALETSEALDNIKDNFNELKDYLNTALPDSKDVHKNLDNIIKINNNIIDDVHSETATLEDITAIMVQLSEKTQDLEKAVTKFKLQ